MRKGEESRITVVFWPEHLEGSDKAVVEKKIRSSVLDILALWWMLNKHWIYEFGVHVEVW